MLFVLISCEIDR